MRIVAALVVMFLGAAMAVVGAQPDIISQLDEFGTSFLVLGGIALAVELYVVPLIVHRARAKK